VFPALLRAVEQVNGAFERAPLSVGRAFGQLTAAADQFLARLDQAIGLSNTLARALSSAARVLDGVRRGAGLLTEGERLGDQRATRDALAAEIARLEAEVTRGGEGRAPRRGSLRSGLVGTAERQAGVDRARRLEELRQQHRELVEEVARGEREAADRGEAERRDADARAAEARRRRGAEQAEELRRQLDDRFRINSEHEDRLRRLREAEASGAIDAAERQRLETLATRERDEALRRLEGSVRRVAAAQRDNRDAEREANEVLREREALIRENENATERYARRLSNLGTLVERAERIGQPVPDETISREAQAALEELERGGERVQQATERASETARELGLTFSSAFEDAVVRGERLSVVLRGIVQDISRLVIRRAVTEPLANLFGNLLGGSEGGFDLGKALENGFGLLGAGGGLRAANGAVLDPLGVVPFARGGVVERPTLFPFAGGTGLMGEAGPEAIMPLRRTRDGRLGVEAAGSAISVTVHINSPDAEGFRRSRAQVSAALTDAVRRGARLR
jgi:hypothetical protein